MTKDILQQILDIGISLTAEEDPNKLLAYIMENAMELTGADGGTLYLLEGDVLKFRIMKTKSKGFDRGSDGEPIDIPAVPLKKENVCAYSAISKTALNIEDVYNNEVFDFSGPKRYDAMNEYRTRSMIAIPMINNEGDVIGVMQLLNATDENGNVRAFSKDEERILLSLASQTAICLANMEYVKNLSKQMWSFTEAMTEAIDARTPYNGSHTRKVAEYSGKIVDRINALHEEGKENLSFSEEHREQVVMAAFLHDIGKMIVPIDVMNKETRLGKYRKDIDTRFENRLLKNEINYLKNRCSEADYIKEKEQLEKAVSLVAEVDSIGFIDDTKMAEICECIEYVFTDYETMEEYPFFDDTEKECMQVRKGTLTQAERTIMENHVVMTERILSKVYFNKSFSMAPIWAAQHHECINNSGYPKKIGGNDLGPEARILAVADICDALLATDRPYKKPLLKEKAFAIMESMANEGKLEMKYVNYLRECLE